MTLIDDYLKEQSHFSNKYGERTIVLMQVGHFYECYGVDNLEEQSNSANLYRLSDILDIQLTRKNKNIKESSRKNPLMIGVNIYSIDKYIQMLLNNNYTSILIEQVSDPPYVERKVTNIYSPGTNVQYNLRGQTNNLMCVYIESNKSLHSASDTMCIGISTIDLSTGKNIVYELYSNENDKNYGLDEIFRFIQTYDPKEIFFIKKNLNHSNDFLSNYLDLSHRVVHFKDEIKKEYYELNYQRTLLDKIFKNTGLLSVVEYLDLENRHFGLLSYICALDFAYEHNSTIVEKISKLDSSSFRVLSRMRDVYLKSEEWELAVRVQKKLISKIKGKEEKESEKKLLCWCIYKIAIGYFNSGNFNTSITKFEQALRENRHCLAGYIMLGEAFLKIKNIKAALKSWKKGYINTKSPVCLIRMEKYYRESGQLGLMIKEYKEALKVPSNSRLGTLSLLLGSLFLEENDPQETIKVIEENIDHEKNIVSSVLLADAYKKQNKNAVSEKFLEKISQQIKGKILSFKCGSCGREVDEWESICLVCNAFDEIRCLPETKS